MEIGEFAAKYGINLDEGVEELITEGLNRMQSSLDPLHAESHIHNIISHLDQFLDEGGELEPQAVDFNVLLPAIAWHDVWRAANKQTTNLFRLKLEVLWDGYGSLRLFRNFTENSPINSYKLKKIGESIYFHAPLRQKSLPHENKMDLEVKLIRDLDLLDMWGLYRLQIAKDAYCTPDGFFHDLKMARVAYMAFSNMVSQEAKFYFSWPAREYEKIRPVWVQRSEEVVHKNLPRLR